MRTLFIIILTLLTISALIIACLAFTQKPKNSEYYKINCCIPNNSQIVTNEYYHKNLSLRSDISPSPKSAWTSCTRSAGLDCLPPPGKRYHACAAGTVGAPGWSPEGEPPLGGAGVLVVLGGRLNPGEPDNSVYCLALDYDAEGNPQPDATNGWVGAEVPGTWDLTYPRYAFDAIIIDFAESPDDENYDYNGFIFAIGGRGEEGVITDKVEYAQLNPEGGLCCALGPKRRCETCPRGTSAWTDDPLLQLPEPRSDHAACKIKVPGKYYPRIYVAGGIVLQGKAEVPSSDVMYLSFKDPVKGDGHALPERVKRGPSGAWTTIKLHMTKPRRNFCLLSFARPTDLNQTLSSSAQGPTPSSPTPHSVLVAIGGDRSGGTAEWLDPNDAKATNWNPATGTLSCPRYYGLGRVFAAEGGETKDIWVMGGSNTLDPPSGSPSSGACRDKGWSSVVGGEGGVDRGRWRKGPRGETWQLVFDHPDPDPTTLVAWPPPHPYVAGDWIGAASAYWPGDRTFFITGGGGVGTDARSLSPSSRSPPQRQVYIWDKPGEWSVPPASVPTPSPPTPPPPPPTPPPTPPPISPTPAPIPPSSAPSHQAITVGVILPMYGKRRQRGTINYSKDSGQRWTDDPRNVPPWPPVVVPLMSFNKKYGLPSNKTLWHGVAMSDKKAITVGTTMLLHPNRMTSRQGVITCSNDFGHNWNIPLQINGAAGVLWADVAMGTYYGASPSVGVIAVGTVEATAIGMISYGTFEEATEGALLLSTSVPPGYSWTGVAMPAAADNVFNTTGSAIAVGYSLSGKQGVIAYSLDAGITWRTSTLPSKGFQKLNSIAMSGNWRDDGKQWAIAVGDYGAEGGTSIAYSTGFDSWSAAVSLDGACSSRASWTSVAMVDKKAIIVGNSASSTLPSSGVCPSAPSSAPTAPVGVYAWSNDGGKTWTSQRFSDAHSILAGVSWQGVAMNGAGVAIAVGYTNPGTPRPGREHQAASAYSTDFGHTWEPSSHYDPGTKQGGFGNQKLYAVAVPFASYDPPPGTECSDGYCMTLAGCIKRDESCTTCNTSGQEQCTECASTEYCWKEGSATCPAVGVQIDGCGTCGQSSNTAGCSACTESKCITDPGPSATCPTMPVTGYLATHAAAGFCAACAAGDNICTQCMSGGGVPSPECATCVTQCGPHPNGGTLPGSECLCSGQTEYPKGGGIGTYICSPTGRPGAGGCAGGCQCCPDGKC